MCAMCDACTMYDVCTMCIICVVLCVCEQQVVNSGALDALVICLEEFDPGVKESSAWALGYIARHNAGGQGQRHVFIFLLYLS